MRGGRRSCAAPPDRDARFSLDIEGRAVPLRIRRNARARRLVLRIDETVHSLNAQLSVTTF